MKVSRRSVCQSRYNEEDRVPLLLQCGHDFCKECLSRMFSASPDTTLACPRCHHVSVVGNSFSTLRKNFSLLHGGSSPDADLTSSSGSEDEEEEDATTDGDLRRRCGGDVPLSSSAREDRLMELELSNLEGDGGDGWEGDELGGGDVGGVEKEGNVGQECLQIPWSYGEEGHEL